METGGFLFLFCGDFSLSKKIRNIYFVSHVSPPKTKEPEVITTVRYPPSTGTSHRARPNPGVYIYPVFNLKPPDRLVRVWKGWYCLRLYPGVMFLVPILIPVLCMPRLQTRVWCLQCPRVRWWMVVNCHRSRVIGQEWVLFSTQVFFYLFIYLYFLMSLTKWFWQSSTRGLLAKFGYM
jgi:hypothetical protein